MAELGKVRIEASTYPGESNWVGASIGFSLYQYKRSWSAILHGKVWKRMWQIRLHNMGG